MTSVIRVKRRIDEDPAEALILSCKRRRENDDLSEIESVLSFAGTIRSKSEPVSSHIKEAIHRRKVHKEIHPHTADYKHALHIPSHISKIRQQTEQASKANRYKVTSSRRALDLNLLDKPEDSDGSDHSSGPSSPQDESENERKTESSNSTDSQQKSMGAGVDNDISLGTSKVAGDSSRSADSSPSTQTSAQGTVHSATAVKTLDSDSPVQEDKMFCIFDVENDGDDDPLKAQQQSGSGITMNNVPMVSQQIPTPLLAEAEYVYDLYYTHNDLARMDPEGVLTVAALCDDFLNDDEDDADFRRPVYDESEDSNDENNWRNDYPDEDPQFFEREDDAYDYAEDMVDTNFLQDDESDLLTYWMNTRCRVDGGTDNEEDEYEKDRGSSSDEDELW